MILISHFQQIYLLDLIQKHYKLIDFQYYSRNYCRFPCEIACRMSKNQLFNKQCLSRQITPQPHKHHDTCLQQLFVKVSASQDRIVRTTDPAKRKAFIKYQSTHIKTIKSKNYASEFHSVSSVKSPRITDCLKTQNFMQINHTARKALFLRQKKKQILNLLQESQIRKVNRNIQVVHSEKQLKHIKVNDQIKTGINKRAFNTYTPDQIINNFINSNQNREKPKTTIDSPQKIKFQPVPEDKVSFYIKEEQPKLYIQKCMYDQLNGVLAQSYGVFLCNKAKFQTLHEKNSKKNVQVASLTKIMTSVLVLSIAKKFSIDIRVQTIRVGHKAAGLQGTTANLLYGDQLSIQDALHGLMLPSGNDAAQALAEWGGKIIRQQCNKFFTKFFDQIGKKKTSPLKLINKMANNDTFSYSSLFIFHMNQLAKALKMSNTKFNNPHGLMDKNNLSCAFDMAILSHYALQNFPEFGRIVQTMNYKTKVSNKTFGSQREVIWNNTHKLLKIPGFKGIKTGVTPSAGPCLSTCFDLGFGEYLLIIVLKTKNQEHRFIETKKLIMCTLKWIGRHDLLSKIQNYELEDRKKQKFTLLSNKSKGKLQNINSKNIVITLNKYTLSKDKNEKQQKYQNNIQKDTKNRQLSQEFIHETQSQSEQGL